MKCELSKPDASVMFLGRKHKAEIWSAILSYNVEPPPVFYASGIHRQIIRETDSNLSPKDVISEIEDFETAGIVERVETPLELPATTKTYKRISASPGWLLVSGVVEAFNHWYESA